MICQYCGKECKNKNSLVQHEIRCKENPDRIESGIHGNHGHMPEHCKSYYTKMIQSRDGSILNITKHQLDEYRKEHNKCEICGKSIEESVKWNSKFAPKQFCVDHDHNTNKFRGLLCSVCNRQLGWYERYKNEIEQYLNK